MTQLKKHNLNLPKSPAHGERSILFAFGVHLHLPIATLQIDVQEPLRAIQSIQRIVYSWG